MSKTRTETWLALTGVALGAVVSAIAGLWVFMSATAPRLHPDPQAVPSIVGPAPPPQWADAVEAARRTVRTMLAEQNLPGVSVAVGIGDDLVWAEGFGWANLDDQVPVSPETRFRIGTASTALTSAAVGRLLEEGRLKLDEPIHTYVPAYPEKPWPVTLRHVMGHLAGLPSDGGDESPLFSVRCDRPVEALRYFKDRPLAFEPGTRFRVSNYGWILVSAAIESVTAEPWLSFVEREVFGPAGMGHTEAESVTSPLPDQATAYFPRFAADPRYGLHLMREIDLSCYAGASIFVSTPSDLVRFAMAVERGTLLQPATVELLQTPQRLASGEQTGYGLGWDVATATLAGRPTRLVGHNGDVLGGTAASFMMIPEHRLAVSVLSNISYADTFSLGVAIAETFVARAKPPPAAILERR
jgi:serine beta-lactamase-like protein LACTB